MAECGSDTFDVISGLVGSEIELMKMLRDMLFEERKDIDRLRMVRYKAVEDLDLAKESSMDFNSKDKELTSIQEKANFVGLLERNIRRKQQYAAIISDILDDRKRNVDELSNERLSLVKDGIQGLNV